MYETIRIVEKLKPKYVIWENVKNVLSQKHRHNFDNYIDRMSELGYTSFYQVLNAKDYGIPQNRERVFTISILEGENYQFPPKQELELRLKDLLEDEVDEKYYLKDYQIENILKSNYNQNKSGIQKKEYCDTLCARDWKDPKCVEVIRKYGIFDDEKGKHQAGSVYDENGLSPTLDTMQGGWRQPCIEEMTEEPKIIQKYGDRGTNNYSVRNYAHTIPSNPMSDRCQLLVEPSFKIRKLTPKETWGLMGFDDEDFEKAAKVNSNTQLYKQAGNSIVVNVLEEILKKLLK